MSKDICGPSPWKGNSREVHAAFELAKRGILPTGSDSLKVNVVDLWRVVYEDELQAVLNPDNEIQ